MNGEPATARPPQVVAAALRDSVTAAVRGKERVVDLALATLLAGGHLLVEDLPGTGKTLLAKSIASSIGGRFGRVQCTPDLLPTDITGTSVYRPDTGEWQFRPGPILGHVVLVDEVNRASPRTQAALLEPMEEHQVTVDGTTWSLPHPFFLIATQNPFGQVGTFPLPESQLDRFLMKITVGYPSRAAELEILEQHGAADPLSKIAPVVDASDVLGMAMAAQTIHVAPTLRGYLIDIAEATRRHPGLLLGMSPRAVLALQRVARVQAASLMRTYVTPDDIKALAKPVLAHRLVVTPEAQLQGITASQVLDQILDAIPVPAGPGV